MGDRLVVEDNLGRPRTYGADTSLFYDIFFLANTFDWNVINNIHRHTI
jgi:hypothetical protein